MCVYQTALVSNLACVDKQMENTGRNGAALQSDRHSTTGDVVFARSLLALLIN